MMNCLPLHQKTQGQPGPPPLIRLGPAMALGVLPSRALSSRRAKPVWTPNTPDLKTTGTFAPNKLASGTALEHNELGKVLPMS